MAQGNTQIVPLALEYSSSLFMLAGKRDDACGVLCNYFTAVLKENAPNDVRPVSETDADLCRGFVGLRDRGFTKKAKQWSGLYYSGYDLNGIEQKDYSIARLWKERTFSNPPAKNKSI